MSQDVLKQLSQKENFRSAKGTITEDEIEIFATELGVSLPAGYSAFLLEWGHAVWFGHRICGIADRENYSAVAQTLRARAADKKTASVAADAVVLMPYDGGGYYMLRCGEKDFGSVVLTETASGGDIVQKWDSFDSFAAYLLSVTP